MSDTLAQAPLDTPTPVAPPVDPAPAPAPVVDPAPAPAPAVDPAPAPAADPQPAPAPEKVATPTWPENWREEIAKGDEKKLKQLQRYSDPIAAINKGFALEAKLSSGEYKPTKLPENATPEQVSEWRKEMGLPDSVDEYKPELPNGIVLGQTDQEVLEGFKKYAFENNLPPETMNKTLAWYFAEQDRVNKVRELQDADHRQAAEDELIGEWGVKNYRQNVAAMATVRDQMPQGLAQRVLMGRTADGKLLGDDPQFLKWFSGLSRELYPSATVVGLDGGKTIESELDQIRAMRREDPSKYEQDFKLQARERELLDAQIRAKGRKA